MKQLFEHPHYQFFVGLFIFLGSLLLFGFGFYHYKQSEVCVINGEYQSLRNMLDVQQILQKNYVQASDLTADILFEKAIKAMTKVDPYSHYDNAVETTLFQARQAKNHCGVGIEIAENQDGLFEVISVLTHSSAAFANVTEGDVLLAVDGESLEGKIMRQCKDLMMGAKGSMVTLTIRDVAGKKRDVKLRRALSNDQDVVGPYHLDEGIWYVRINRLGRESSKYFRQILDEIERHNAHGLLLDLRGTPGGELHEAFKICNLFIEAGKPIVKLKTTQKDDEGKWLLSELGFKNMSMPMAILVDGMTASAAEIVACALRDHQRALVIGQPTFGKGIAQSEFLLRDGASVWLTNACYFSPRGYSIDRRGVEPDFYVRLSDEAQSNVRKQRRYYGSEQGRVLIKADSVLQDAFDKIKAEFTQTIKPNPLLERSSK